MNQSPETKVLRDLVTAIKRGKKPDIAAAEALLNNPSLDADYIDRARRRADDKAYAARCRLRLTLQNTAKAQRIIAAYSALTDSIAGANSAAVATYLSRRNEILAAARSGKLTKKQFDQAIKELCK